MKQRPRICYSASQRAVIWHRWRKGDTIHQIAGLFDRFHSSIQRILAETGGIRPAWTAVPAGCSLIIAGRTGSCSLFFEGAEDDD